MACDNTVREEFLVCQPEVLGPVGNEHVKLLEAAFIKQQVNAFPGSKLAFGMLILNSFFAAALTRFLPVIKELLDSFLTLH
ncbi:MAG: hypothetical protein BWY89_01585 [Bacteroidetes bacterium ADurb.BinA012]|nr:MAG: hypothetical protein BWY89_01585 [Bacteroidetes bacterium ADurb.BinA012]